MMINKRRKKKQSCSSGAVRKEFKNPITTAVEFFLGLLCNHLLWYENYRYWVSKCANKIVTCIIPISYLVSSLQIFPYWRRFSFFLRWYVYWILVSNIDLLGYQNPIRMSYNFIQIVQNRIIWLVWCSFLLFTFIS